MHTSGLKQVWIFVFSLYVLHSLCLILLSIFYHSLFLIFFLSLSISWFLDWNKTGKHICFLSIYFNTRSVLSLILLSLYISLSWFDSILLCLSLTFCLHMCKKEYIFFFYSLTRSLFFTYLNIFLCIECCMFQQLHFSCIIFYTFLHIFSDTFFLPI